MERLHRISIIVDQAGQAAGAVVTTDYDTREARHRPVEVGPFDTLDEVLTACRAHLDIQLTLW